MKAVSEPTFRRWHEFGFVHRVQSFRKRPIRLGFVALNDAAPLAAAEDLGCFEEAGLDVALSRELGWASVREKLVFGELDAAHAPFSLPLAITLGLGCVAVPCLASMVLSRGGNALTLAQRLKHAHGKAPPDILPQRRPSEPYVFGVVSLYSSHHFFARRWLAARGLNPERDVRFVVVPPAQTSFALAEGHLDGFCSGEPWNSLAVKQGAGWIAALDTAENAAAPPEKVLAVRGSFASEREVALIALNQALLRACRWCDTPAGRAKLPSLLARPDWLDCPPELIAAGMSGQIGRCCEPAVEVPCFHRFSGAGANSPDPAGARTILDHFCSAGLLPRGAVASPAALAQAVYRQDLYTRALAAGGGAETI